MESTFPSLAVLVFLLALANRRDTLLGDLAEAERLLASARSAAGHFPVATASPARPGPTTLRPDALAEAIVSVLRGAGDKGLPVRELSRAVGTRVSDLHAWFDNAGKHLGRVQRIGPSAYRLKPGAAESV